MSDTLLMLLSIGAVNFAAAASPGPAFLAQTRTAAAAGRRRGLACAAGLAAGSAIWAAATLFGLAALFLAAPWLATALKYAGAAYLMWLAIGLFRKANAPEAAEAAAAGSRGFSGGLLLQLSNPKAAVFFGSVFVAIVPADASAALSATIVAIVGLSDLLWFAGLAIAFGAAPVRAWFASSRAWLDRVAGAAMAALAVRLAGS